MSNKPCPLHDNKSGTVELALPSVCGIRHQSDAIGTWRQERTTALMAAGSKKAAGKVPVSVVTRHRRRQATVASSEFFCVPFGGRANRYVCRQY
jgi:hypothetical protein